MKRRTRRKTKAGRTGRILFVVLIVIPASLLLLLALLNWVIMPLFTRYGRELEVPELVGQTRAAAEQAIEAAGLRLGEIRIVGDTTQPPGHIVFQVPRPGRMVKAGRLVSIDVSRGANRLLIPDIIGMAVDRATAQLEDLGFIVSEIESLRTPNVPVGRIMAIRPMAGTEVDRGSTVILAVAAPVGKFPMPNLLGVDLETASGIIASQGLILGGVREAPSDEPVGIVLVQFPEEGMSVQDGDSVHMIVAVPFEPDSTP